MVWPQLAALLMTYPIFLWIVDTRSALSLLGGFGILALVGSMPYSAFYVALAEGLPKPIRGTAFATIYAVAIASFGGTAQLIVTWLIHVTGSALAPAWYMLLATAVGLVAMTMMRETAPNLSAARGGAGPATRVQVEADDAASRPVTPTRRALRDDLPLAGEGD